MKKSGSSVSSGLHFRTATLLLAPLLAAGVAVAETAAARSVALVDVNRDGYLDLVDRGRGVSFVYLNDGTGRFSLAQLDASVGEPSAGDPAGDVDRDGDPDRVAIDDGRAAILLAASNDNYVVHAFDAETNVTDTGVAAGDVDADGDVDIVVFSSGRPDRLHINRDVWGTCGGDTAACFDGIDLGQPRASLSHAGALGDVDADGLLDLVVVTDSRGETYFGQANGRDANPFTAAPVAFSLSGLRVASLSASKGMVDVANYTPPPGHASCDPAVPTGSASIVASAAPKGDQQVRDHGEPVQINLIGPACLTVEQGFPFVDPGANAYTPVFGDLTDWIVVSNPVNTNVVGTYTVTYHVEDHDGYEATVWRTVFVKPAPGAAQPSDGGGGGGGGSLGLEAALLSLLALLRRPSARATRSRRRPL